MIIHPCSLCLHPVHPRHARDGRRARVAFDCMARVTVLPHNPWPTVHFAYVSQPYRTICPHNQRLADHMYTHEHTSAHMSTASHHKPPRSTTHHTTSDIGGQAGRCHTIVDPGVLNRARHCVCETSQKCTIELGLQVDAE